MNPIPFKQLTISKAALLLTMPVIAVMCCLPLKNFRHKAENLWNTHQVDMGVDKKCSKFPSYTMYLKLNRDKNTPVIDVSFTYLPSCSASTGQLVVNILKNPVCEG